MSGTWKKFINNNIILLTGIPLIIGIHWGWWSIQQNPDLVDPKSRREMPLYSMYKEVYRTLVGDNKSDVGNAEPEQTFKE